VWYRLPVPRLTPRPPRSLGALRAICKVLDDCAKYEKNDGSIDIDEAKLILSDLLDGPARKVGGANETKSAVTNVELDTAQYAFDNFTWSPAAKDWFFEQLTSKNW